MQTEAAHIEERFSTRGLVRLMLPLVIEQLLAVSVGLAEAGVE